MLIFKTGHKKLAFLTVVLMGIETTNFVFLAHILTEMIRSATIQSMDLFVHTAIKGITGFLLFMLLDFAIVWCKTTLVKRVNLTIKRTLIQDIVYHADQKDSYSSELSLMTNDLKQLETKGIESELMMFKLAATALFALVGALFYDIWITLIFLVGSFVPPILSMTSQGPVQKASNRWTQANSFYTERLKDYFNGIETARTYQAEKHMIERATDSAAKMESALAKMNRLVENYNQVIFTVAMLGSMMVPYGFGIYRVMTQGVTIATLLGVVQLANSIVNPLMQLSGLANEYGTTAHIRKRYEEALERQKEKEKKENQAPKFETIGLENAGIQFGENYLFRHANFALSQGDKVLIIGPSGIGKSTLLRLLQRTIRLTEGQYLYNGKNFDGDVSALFALIRQQAFVFNDTIRYNITLGEDFNEEEIMTAIHLACLDEVIAEKGLDYEVGENGQNLSGGQLQRIEIARALVRHRPVILADEMTSALDSKTAEKVRANLLALPGTFVEVSHNYTEEDLKKYNQVWDLGQYQ